MATFRNAGKAVSQLIKPEIVKAEILKIDNNIIEIKKQLNGIDLKKNRRKNNDSLERNNNTI
jgi:hypothetical protein